MSHFLHNATIHHFQNATGARQRYLERNAHQHDALIVVADEATAQQLLADQRQHQPIQRLHWTLANFATPASIERDLAHDFRVAKPPAYSVFVWGSQAVREHLPDERLELWLATVTDTVTLTMVD